MKKTLIALAALAATGAFAQSTVTISGTLDPSVNVITKEYGNGTSNTQTAVNNNQQGTENFTLSGTEDLGGGLKAEFLYELDFVSKTTTVAPTNGQTYAGLSGGFGSIKLGTPNSPTLTTQGNRSPFTTKTGGRADLAGLVMFGKVVTRQAGSIVYATPSMSGFSAALGYTPGTTAHTSPAIAEVAPQSDLGLFYANGALSAGLSFYNKASTAAAGSEYLNTLNVKYNFGPGALYLGAHRHDNAGSVDVGYNLGADFAVAKNTSVLFNYETLDDQTSANNDSRMMSLGLKYTMSKRTSAYARLVNQTVDNTTGTAVKSANATIVGLQHNF